MLQKAFARDRNVFTFPKYIWPVKKQTVCHQKICSVEHETFRASKPKYKCSSPLLVWKEAEKNGEEGEVEEDEGH